MSPLPPIANPARKTSPLKNLVVEDNPDLAANLVDYLTAKGHLVDAAGDGIAGLHPASSQSFDVILPKSNKGLA